jgi:hypothetical protein
MAGAIRNLLLRDARLETAILGELRELPVAKNLNPFGFVGIYYLRRLSDSFVAHIRSWQLPNTKLIRTQNADRVGFAVVKTPCRSPAFFCHEHEHVARRSRVLKIMAVAA